MKYSRPPIRLALNDFILSSVASLVDGGSMKYSRPPIRLALNDFILSSLASLAGGGSMEIQPPTDSPRPEGFYSLVCGFVGRWGQYGNTAPLSACLALNGFITSLGVGDNNK